MAWDAASVPLRMMRIQKVAWGSKYTAKLFTAGIGTCPLSQFKASAGVGLLPRSSERSMLSLKPSSSGPRQLTSGTCADVVRQVRADVIKSLRLCNPAVFVQSFNRTNLFFRVEEKPDKSAKAMEYVAEFIVKQNQMHGTG